jgi:hypothetical protein
MKYIKFFKMDSELINMAIKIPKTTIARSRLVILIVIFTLFVASVNVKSSEKANAEPIKTVNTIRIGIVDVDAVKQIMI